MFVVSDDLHEIYSQYTKLCQLVLSIPATSAASSVRSTSILKHVKLFLRNTMENDERLSCLSTLAIEKQLLGVMVKDPMFVEDVINEFAEKKDKRFELTYKKI